MNQCSPELLLSHKHWLLRRLFSIYSSMLIIVWDKKERTKKLSPVSNWMRKQTWYVWIITLHSEGPTEFQTDFIGGGIWLADLLLRCFSVLCHFVRQLLFQWFLYSTSLIKFLKQCWLFLSLNILEYVFELHRVLNKSCNIKRKILNKIQNIKLKRYMLYHLIIHGSVFYFLLLSSGSKS